MSHALPNPRTTAAMPSLRFSDPVNYSRVLRKAHEDVISGGHRPEIAEVIQESWRRSLALGISPDQHSPRHVREADDVVGLRESHQLAPAIPALAELLGDDSRDGRQLLVITDHLGEVLWRIGSKDALALGESLEFVEGADWSESGIGTNAISEVLRTGNPGQLFSAEHLVRTHHEWACTAAPIRHPATGQLLGVLDLSGPLDTLTSDSLRMIRCAVRVAEELIVRAAYPSGAAGGSVWAAAPQATADVGYRGERSESSGSIVSIELLGEKPAIVRRTGQRVPLTMRRAEILALLCSRQQGWSADELAYELYGEAGTAASVRIEVHRLRNVLGPFISSNPYRLETGMRERFDVNRVLTALRDGDVHGALSQYPAPLLSRSATAAVELLREELSSAVRTALHAELSVPALTAWLATDMGAGDAIAVAALKELTGPGDPRAAVFSARVNRLDRALI